jgi:hypothetical protein
LGDFFTKSSGHPAFDQGLSAAVNQALAHFFANTSYDIGSAAVRQGCQIFLGA